MGVGFKKTLQTTGDRPIWQGKGSDIQLAQGGFVLDTTGYTTGYIIPGGTPMAFDESTRVAKAIKTGVMYATASGSATDYQVKKGHDMKVGDYFARVSGNKAYAITVINTSNADYDVVTVGTTIGAASTDDMVFASTTTGATTSSYGGVKGLLYTDTRVDSGESVSIVLRGTVCARRVPYSTDLETALPKIIYSQSY